MGRQSISELSFLMDISFCIFYEEGFAQLHLNNSGVNLAAKLKHDLDMDTVYYWTNSKIVLAWLNSKSSLFHTFVAN